MSDHAVRVRVTQEGTEVEIAIAGEVDYETRDTVASAIIDALARRPDGLIIDLRAVTFIDSVGVETAIASPARRAASLGLVLRIETSAAVRRILDQMGLDDLVDRSNHAGDRTHGRQ